jgi:hypothetical protein
MESMMEAVNKKLEALASELAHMKETQRKKNKKNNMAASDSASGVGSAPAPKA